MKISLFPTCCRSSVDIYERQPDNFAEFLQCFEQARNHAKVPSLSGMAVHPAFAALHCQHHTTYTKALRCFLYRADLWSLTVYYVYEGRARTKGQEPAQNHARVAFKAGHPAAPTVAVIFGAVQRKGMLEHFRQIVCVSVAYALPSYSGVVYVTC